MYNNKISLFLFLLFIPGIMMQVSCKKLVTVDLPVSKIVTGTVFSNDYTATEALTSIYSQMSNESYNMAKATGILGDELINYFATVDQKAMYSNSMDPITNNTSGCWYNAYNYIYQANAVIAGLATVSGASPAVKQQLTGEALLIRAFWHFYLTNAYGAVPLAITTDYSVNSLLARTDTAKVYQQIILDLQQAEGLLNSQYVDFTDTALAPERVRPAKAAAAALLARAFLYTHQYDSAVAAATRVISNTNLFQLEPDLNNVFLIAGTTGSHEAIWQLQTPTPNQNVNTIDGHSFIILTKPPSGFAVTSLSNQLLGSFETGDLRRAYWIHDTIITGSPYSYAYKYKIQTNANLTEYDMMLRLGEQYLIRAEAEINLNDLPAAANDLDAIRNRAGLANLPDSIATSQTAMLQACLHERQVELFTEWGNRWFDLRRTGNIDAVMSMVTPTKGGVWDSPKDRLFPIPQTERTLDPNLDQNIGY